MGNDNIINFITASGGSGSSVSINSYTITSGWYMNNSYLTLPISGSLNNTTLNINGLIYTSGDYSITLSNTYSIKWNNIVTQPGGFNLGDTDKIVLNYYEE